jgi:sulfopyruvate decarboxylase alpha subunit
MNMCQIMYRVFEEEGIGLISSLPCNKFAALIENLPPRLIHVHVTREENGVGISAGFSLTSGKPLMLIQSTGLGNSLNALMGLHASYHLPLPIIASWRGRENDKPETQIPFGKNLPELCRALGLPCTIVEEAGQLDRVAPAIHDSFTKSFPHIILLAPEIWASNDDVRMATSYPERKRKVQLSYDEEFREPELSGGEAMGAMKDFFGDAIVLSTIGQNCDELYRVADRDLNFYVAGAMGQASPVALGMALNTKKKVYVIDGDGSLLMNPGILTDISGMRPANLTVILLDNGAYGTTGDQKIASYDHIDLSLVARSLGIGNTKRASTVSEIADALKSMADGPNLLHVPVKVGKSPKCFVPMTPPQMRDRFMKAVSEGSDLSRAAAAQR